MTTLTIQKTLSLAGKATPPGSKSQSIRGIIFALMAKGESILQNVLNSDDIKAALDICSALGAQIEMTQQALIIKSNGLPLMPSNTEMNSGNSGITTLFTLPLLGLRENCDIPVLFDCGEQMRHRPIKPLIDALGNLGMIIHHVAENNKLPISVMGKLHGGVVEIEGMNSQYLSALLIALPCAKNNSIITVQNLRERPYVDMTLDFLKNQKVIYTHEHKHNLDIFKIQGNQYYTSVHQSIKGDFSSASCLIAAAALIRSNVELQGLDFNDSQGDKRLVTILRTMGAEIITEGNSIKIIGNKTLTGIYIDANDIPDLVPALAVIGTQATGKTEIYNVKQARIKETDRIHSMTEGLRKMGAHIEEHEDGMTVYKSDLQGASVEGYGDHRTVMALSIAGMLANGKSTITDGEAIHKTYPSFVDTIKSLGANIAIDKATLSNSHIMLIGFKHVGKTLIGEQLAKKINKKFIDLDSEIEKLYFIKYDQKFSCRQIMQSRGESYYRILESEALSKALKLPSCVISLGGGVPLEESNRALIKSHILLHIVVSRGIAFERIMVGGIPAFFDSNVDPYESFNRLWDSREEIYKQLATFTVNNNNSIEYAVSDAVTQLKNMKDYL